MAEIIILEGTFGSQAEHAKHRARLGDPSLTASFLYWDNTLSASQKGKILAEAYSRDAEKAENLTRESGEDGYAIRAQKSKKIKQGLMRAAKKTQNP